MTIVKIEFNPHAASCENTGRFKSSQSIDQSINPSIRSTRPTSAPAHASALHRFHHRAQSTRRHGRHRWSRSCHRPAARESTSARSPAHRSERATDPVRAVPCSSACAWRQGLRSWRWRRVRRRWPLPCGCPSWSHRSRVRGDDATTPASLPRCLRTRSTRRALRTQWCWSPRCRGTGGHG